MKLINLLPKPKQEELRFESLFYGLLVVFAMSAISFGLVFLAQFGVKFYLAAKSQALNAEISQLQSQVNKQDNADIKKKIQGINDVVSDFNNLAGAEPEWYRIIKAFAPLPPAGVRITSLTVDPIQKSINITGFSPTRDLVIQLYNNILQDSADFYNIDYPLENVSKPTSINFHFTFYIQSQLLK